MKFFEIFGFPGAGKSTFRKKFIIKNKIFSLEEIFFRDIFADSYKYNFLFYKILFFFNKKKFYDLMFQNYQSKKNKFISIIKKKINLNVRKFEIKNKNVFKSYNNLIKLTLYSNSRKKRNIDRFRYFVAIYNYVYNKYKNSNLIILQDEAFFQKIFLNYKFNNKQLFNRIDHYLSCIPKVDKAIFVNEKIEICIDRLKKRKKIFNYQNLENEKKIFIKIKKRLNLNKRKLFIDFNVKKNKNLKEIIFLIKK